MPKRKLLLKRDVKDLGEEGDVVEVAIGHARNYLLPRGFAVDATDAILAKMGDIKKRRERIRAQRMETARTASERLKGVSVTVRASAGPEGKLYGSVTAREIEEALRADGVELSGAQVELAEPLKELGTHDVTIRLHPEVETAIRVWIVEK